jgi:hypothetical protein
VEARVTPSTIVLSQRILTWLTSPAHAEALLGDLLEECRLRQQAGSPASISRWYWMQLASSIPFLLWATLRRRSSLITLVTAVASYLAAGGVQFALQFALKTALSPVTTSMFVGTVIVLLCGVAAMTAAGYVAALIRPGAARLLAFLVFVATCVMMALNRGSVSLWYQGSFLVLGSLAPIAGAAFSGRWRRAS